MLNIFTDIKLVAVGVASYFTGIASAIIFYEIHRFFGWLSRLF